MPELEAVLEAVAESVVERMFFAAVLGQTAAPAGEDCLVAAVEFSGELCGVLRIALPESAAQAHTAAFLGGCDAQPPDEETRAVVGELANVLCGAMLAQLSPEGSFAIAPPRLFEGAAAARSLQEMTVCRALELDTGPLAIAVNLRAGDRPC